MEDSSCSVADVKVVAKCVYTIQMYLLSPSPLPVSVTHVLFDLHMVPATALSGLKFLNSQNSESPSVDFENEKKDLKFGI